MAIVSSVESDVRAYCHRVQLSCLLPGEGEAFVPVMSTIREHGRLPHMRAGPVRRRTNAPARQLMTTFWTPRWADSTAQRTG